MSSVTGEPLGRVAFGEHLELLHLFLAERDQIVERIQGLLNAQRMPIESLQDRARLSRVFEDCFFTLAAMPPRQSRLRGRLQESHWASGFRPRRMPGLHNDLVDAGEMMIRAFHLWRQTRWPGRNGRIRYAHTLFNLYVLRCLELLAMRLWDDGASGAGERLSQIQRLLGQLWRSSPADQPVLVRDARWLFPLAQSPTTDELAAYFDVSERIAGSLSQEDRIEIQAASVQMAGGHLRSQLLHCCTEKGVSIDEKDLVLSTRNSNALDFALLIQGLATLLEAYEEARERGDGDRRLRLAGAICQGVSPDPELFVNRLDLLGAYSMIEYLFIAADGEGRVAYTPMGERHVRLLQEYAARMRRSSKALLEDCARFRPVEGAYSPYGVIYGFSSNLTEHMALKTLQADADTRFSVEDVFVDGEDGAQKLAWVSGWRKLPHIDKEVQRQFDYPQQFAELIFERIERALRKRACDAGSDSASRTGRLFLQIANASAADSRAALCPELPARYLRSSDRQIAAAQRAQFHDERQLLRDRQEGMFMVSFETSGGWTALSKDILTEVLGAGRDARATGLPASAACVLSLMAPQLAILS
jgi:hypothetical protein